MFLRFVVFSLTRVIFRLWIATPKRDYTDKFIHIRPCSLLPLLPLFFASCRCFFCASPFSFCLPCVSLSFVRALCLFSVAFWRVAAVFFCASPFSFCFPCFSLLFVRAVCLFSVAFWRVAAVFSVPRPFCSAFRSSRCYLCAPFAFFSIAFCFTVQQTQKA